MTADGASASGTARRYPLLSSDSHVMEPGNLWIDRCKGLPEVPRLERRGGRDVWVFGDRLLGSTAPVQPGVRFADPSKLKVAGLFEEMVPAGAYDPDARIAEQDVDGVAAEVLYTTIGLIFYQAIRESEVLTELCRAYNDWLAEFCAAHPDRLYGMAMLNVDDIEGAVAELERTRNLGLVGAMIPVYPRGDLPPYGNEAYEPLWAAAENLAAPLAMHLATNRPGAEIRPDLTLEFPAKLGPAFYTNADIWIRLTLTDVILGGVFERRPNLTLGCVEHELGWIPYFLHQLDYTYTDRLRRSFWPPKFTSDLMPSDYFRSNVFSSFQEDPLGMPMREIIGVDGMMWGSDYPHIESTWPRSREFTERVMAGVPDHDREKVLAGNVARVFGIKY